MKRSLTTMISVLFVMIMSSSCVSQYSFDKFVDDMKFQNEILACELRVDVNEAKFKSDEPDGTRRDEPIRTRRDEPSGTRRDLDTCNAEFDRVVGNTGAGTDKYPKCQPKMKDCVVDGTSSVPECNACFDTCMASADGTWPVAACPLP